MNKTKIKKTISNAYYIAYISFHILTLWLYGYEK